MAGLSVIALLVFIMGIFSILWGMALGGIGGLAWLTGLIFSGSVQAWGSSAFGSGVVSIFAGIVEVIASFGLFAHKNWARITALITSGVSLVLSLIGLINGSFLSLFGIILPAVIFFYLLSNSQAKRAFKGM